MKLNVAKFTFNPFQENTFIVYSDSKQAVIFDPGCFEPHEQAQIDEFIKEKELTLLAILGTHAHLDHVFGNNYIMDKYNVPYYLHADDVSVLNNFQLSGAKYGIMDLTPRYQPTHFLTDDQDLELGDISFKVLHTPGHAPGHVVFYNADNHFVINGDVLFAGSYGRTDLPGGDHMTLVKSITEVMFNLPEDTLVCCGHGPETTIRHEKQSNPILSF